MSVFPCPKCGAALSVKPGMQTATCSYCSTATYIDRSSALFYYILPFSIDSEKAKGIFRRWTAGPELAKELETEANITNITKEYFPVFRFRRSEGGQEQVIVKPARGTTLPGMQRLVIPPGNITAYDASFSPGDAAVLPADISIDSYLDELPGTAIDQALVYFPVYRIIYEFRGETYGIVLDGSSGSVYSSHAPGRSPVSYLAVMGIAFVPAFAGGFLMMTVSPVFFLLIIAGFAAGKILGTRVAAKPGAVT
jgi:hypothetical protein